MASWLRYPGSRVRAFDAKYGMYALCRAVGGVHYDVGGSERVGVMPYARVEDEHERSEYLRGLDLAHAIALMASQLPDDWEVIADESGQLRIMPPPRPAPPS